MFEHFKIYIAFIISALLCSHMAHAKDCYEKSPNYSDTYFNLEKITKLSGEQADKIKTVLTSLKGKWVGESTIINCQEGGAAYTTSHSAIKLKTTLTNNHVLSMTAQKHNITRKTKQSETIHLLRNQIFHLQPSKTNNDIAFSEKFRRKINLNQNNLNKTKNKDAKNKNASNNKIKPIKISRLNEIIYEIKPSNNAFNFTRYFYTNGIYVGQEQWVMHKNGS